MYSFIFNIRRFFVTVSFSALLLLLLATPVYANVPLGWSLYIVNGLPFAAYATWGAAFILVLFIEALFFRVILKKTWRQSLHIVLIANIISTVAGLLLSGFTVLLREIAFIVLIIAVPIVAFRFLKGSGKHLWFSILALIAFIFGLISLFEVENAVYPAKFHSSEALWMIMATPLLMAFGLSLIIEAVAIFRIFKIQHFYVALFIGNLCSYVLIYLIFPFILTSPYKFYGGYSSYIQLEWAVVKGNHEKALNVINRQRMDMVHLLNLRKYEFPESYDARFELYFFDLNTPQCNDAPMIILSEILKIPTLEMNARKRFEWYQDYYEYYGRASICIQNEDEEELSQIIMEWNEWREANPYPEPNETHRRVWVQSIEDDIETLRGCREFYWSKKQ